MAKPTRNDVIRCYRQFLGREPESDAVVASHLKGVKDVWSLIEKFMNSHEYQARLRERFKKETPLNVPLTVKKPSAQPSAGRLRSQDVSAIEREVAFAIGQGNLRSIVQRFSWFHSIDLGQGVITEGRKSAEIVAQEAETLFRPVSLSGKSLLDIGAWNGAYSFEAKRRGAARVVAADSGNWHTGKMKGFEAFSVARAALQLDIEDFVLNIEHELPDNFGPFDIVLFSGVFYHLRNPLFGLANAARLARECLIVETHIETRDGLSMTFYPGRELAYDPSNWWGPTEAMMVALLRDNGFRQVDVSNALAQIDNRRIFHAWR